MPGQESYKPLIFISHSAKDVSARAILSILYTTLYKDYEVLLDRKRLHPSDPWRKELHTWMGLCHGAIVLLSEHALHSNWVKKETTILRYRSEMDDNFVFIPILIPPVETEMLKHEEFGPLELGAIQMAVGETPEAIVEQILGRLKPLKERLGRRTPLQEVEYVIAIILSKLEEGKYPRPLIDASAMLRKRMGWRPDRGYGAQLARDLLSADLEQVVDVLVFLAKYFEEKEKTVVRILNLLGSFWVDPDAVEELGKMNKRPRGQRAVSMSGIQYPFTGSCYIQRACAGTYDWVSAKISSLKGYEEIKPEERVKLIEREIKEQVLSQLGFDEEDEFSTEDIERRLTNMEKKEPLFVLIPKGFDEELTALLRERLKSFTFFMLEGNCVPNAPKLKDWQIVLLKPDLTPGRDQAVYDLLGDTRGKIRRTL